MAAVQPVLETNTFIHLNKYSPNAESNTDDLCNIAQMDGWHDHKSLFAGAARQTELQTLIAGQSINNICLRPRPATDEDGFLYRILSSDPARNAFCKPKYQNELQGGLVSPGLVSPVIIDPVNGKQIWILSDAEIQYLYSDVVDGRYKVAHIITNPDDDKDDEITDDVEDAQDNNTDALGTPVPGLQSQIQICLQQFGIRDTVHILRDVAYGNWADDVKQWGQGVENNDSEIITLVSATCRYDPGPTLTCGSGSGKRHGFANVTSRSRFAIFDTSKSEETLVEFPKFAEVINNINSNVLIYSRFASTLHSSVPVLTGSMTIAQANTRLTEAEATLYIKDIDNPSNKSVYIVDKRGSNKEKHAANLPLKDVVNIIGCFNSKLPVGHPFDEGEFKYIITASGVKKLLSKKFGDHGIALTTTRSKMYYKKCVPTADGNCNFVDGSSDGIHAFLSYDKVAIASAIEYGAPIVIYNTKRGFIIYVSQMLYDEKSTYYAKLLSHMKDLTLMYNKLFKLKTEYDGIIQRIVNDRARIDAYYAIVNNILTTLPIATNDIEYRFWLSIYYLFSQFIKLYNDFIKEYPVGTRAEPNNSEYDILMGPEPTGIQHTIQNEYQAKLDALSQTITSTLSPPGTLPPNIDILYDRLGEFQNPVSNNPIQNIAGWMKSGNRQINPQLPEISAQYIPNDDRYDAFKARALLLISAYEKIIKENEMIKLIQTVFHSILTRIDIAIKPQPQLIVRCLTFDETSNTTFGPAIIQVLNINHNKIIEMVCNTSGPSTILSANPFNSTMTTRILRGIECIGRTLGVSQRIPSFGTSVIKYIISSLQSQLVPAPAIGGGGGIAPDLSDRFISQFRQICSSVNASCAAHMKPILHQVFLEINSDLPSVQIPATAMTGGSRRLNNNSRNKMVGGVLPSLDQKLHREYTLMIGLAWIILYLHSVVNSLNVYIIQTFTGGQRSYWQEWLNSMFIIPTTDYNILNPDLKSKILNILNPYSGMYNGLQNITNEIFVEFARFMNSGVPSTIDDPNSTTFIIENAIGPYRFPDGYFNINYTIFAVFNTQIHKYIKTIGKTKRTPSSEIEPIYNNTIFALFTQDLSLFSGILNGIIRIENNTISSYYQSFKFDNEDRFNAHIAENFVDPIAVLVSDAFLQLFRRTTDNNQLYMFNNYALIINAIYDRLTPFSGPVPVVEVSQMILQSLPPPPLPRKKLKMLSLLSRPVGIYKPDERTKRRQMYNLLKQLKQYQPTITKKNLYNTLNKPINNERLHKLIEAGIPYMTGKSFAGGSITRKHTPVKILSKHNKKYSHKYKIGRRNHKNKTRKCNI